MRAQIRLSKCRKYEGKIVQLVKENGSPIELTLQKSDLEILLQKENCTMIMEIKGSPDAPFLVNMRTMWMPSISYLDPGMSQSFIRIGNSKSSRSHKAQQFIMKFENNDYSLAGGRISVTQ